ncbi:kinesin-domain-containing protein [Rhizoclosmatium globosum]|uniref:Kinesin-domain-containing protein n=1 Tax=Rhizoclosmatium globosum TaxID=329046 RepID=A0A1Y2B790_9FUNG|nr:kinesin-domain-containing protein [Rhizoclosmatium globosum]|eukprot:ORY30713.1 kinesin-domain-containing protein [Rhizoclosmatium globosum]
MSASSKEKEEAKHVKVVIRTRPTSEFANDEIKFDPDQKSLHIHIPKGSDGGFINNQQENWDFRFDNILHNASQEKVYDECGLPIIKSVMDGYHGITLSVLRPSTIFIYSTGTIMAYGQTGAGKTFTMTGATENYKHRGLIPRAISHIFREVAERPQMACTIRVSYLEIYNEQIVDLLATLPDAEHGIEGTSLAVVEDNKTGETNRSIAEHQLNKISTRHQQIPHILEQVIIALSDRKRDHIPYRQSKLTHVLRDSLGGSCNTLMIANIWGEKEHIEETISTLRFATRMMCFDAVALMKKYEREVRELKQELAMHDSLANRSHVQYESFGEAQRGELGKVVKAYLRDEEAELEFKLIYKALEQERDDLVTTIRKMAANGGAGVPGGLIGDKHDEVRGSKVLHEFDRDDCVGDTEASGFSVGLAPGNKELLYRSNIKKKKGGAVAMSRPLNGGPYHDEDDDFTYERDISSRQDMHNHLPTLPGKRAGSGKSTVHHAPAHHHGLQPISRAEEFENFKRGKAQKCTASSVKTKVPTYQYPTFTPKTPYPHKKKTASLKEKKKSAQTLAATLSDSKTQIDTLKSQIEAHSDVIIDEEEYALIEKLKSVKASYRENVEMLKGVRGEVGVRQKLMVEFEAWFEGNFGVGGVGGVEEGGGASYGEDLMDIGEKFDRLQLEKMSQEDPDSLPFYNARKNTKRMIRVEFISFS